MSPHHHSDFSNCPLCSLCSSHTSYYSSNWRSCPRLMPVPWMFSLTGILFAQVILQLTPQFVQVFCQISPHWVIFEIIIFISLFKIIILISLSIPSTPDFSYSALYLVFHIYHPKFVIIYFLCLWFIISPTTGV